MSQESRGGVFEDTRTNILDHDQEREMRPNHSGRRYENPNHRSNNVPERPVKKVLKKKKKSNAGKICSFTGVVLVILIIGAFLLVKFQKEIESKIFTLKSSETENRTIPPTTKKKNLDQSPEQNNNSGGKSSVLVKTKVQEKENESAELEEEEPIAGLEDRKDVTVETNDEPPPHRVPISVGASESKTTTKSDTGNTGTKLKSEITPPPEEPVVLPENPTTEHLFKAIEDGDVRMAKALIEAGVDLKKFNTEGYNTLHYAAKRLNVEIMKAILESGPGKIDIEARTQDTDLNMLTALHVVSVNATLIDVSDQLAVDAARLLISHNADIESKAGFSFTPLALAVKKASNFPLVKYLLEQGSNPKVIVEVMKSNLLHLAMESCNPDIIQILISSGVPVDGLNSEFRQPIHDAAFLGCIVGMRKLFVYGKVDKNAKTPLPDEIGDINENDERFNRILCGSTPLHFAALAEKREAVEYLLLCGAKTMIYDSQNYSAYDYAEDANSQEIMDLIMKYHPHS